MDSNHTCTTTVYQGHDLDYTIVYYIYLNVCDVGYIYIELVSISYNIYYKK